MSLSCSTSYKFLKNVLFLLNRLHFLFPEVIKLNGLASDADGEGTDQATPFTSTERHLKNYKAFLKIFILNPLLLKGVFMTSRISHLSNFEARPPPTSMNLT